MRKQIDLIWDICLQRYRSHQFSCLPNNLPIHLVRMANMGNWTYSKAFVLLYFAVMWPSPNVYGLSKQEVAHLKRRILEIKAKIDQAILRVVRARESLSQRLVFNPQHGCSDGYSYLAHTRLCYRAYNRRKNYDQALAICQTDGGTLAMPRDIATNDFLIELKNAANRNAFFFFGLDRRNGSWNYVDGGGLRYTDWGEREPNNYGGNEECADYFPATKSVEILRNKWNDERCSRLVGFICEAVGKCPELTAPTNGAMNGSNSYGDVVTFICNTGYNLVGSSTLTCLSSLAWSGNPPTCARCSDGYSYLAHTRLCYRAYNRRKNYDQALAICQTDGGTLAMPRDIATNDFLIELKNAANRNAFFFFGLDRKNGSWNYVDGGGLRYTDWGEREPSNHGGNEECADYFPATKNVEILRNKWNDERCSRLVGFICEAGKLRS
ncbi:macrophage mannose receptor 1-like [Branchiostoma floridae]|uniref:Macrophage mannose receptor 1-like n=1 Tax=Branchiostoma floridae TaxID=7739 RepID=A0A9J7HMA9_BRAFL|nr:macrophage mannose receptor 1-like [Branchiostoma floridae]